MRALDIGLVVVLHHRMHARKCRQGFGVVGLGDSWRFFQRVGNGPSSLRKPKPEASNPTTGRICSAVLVAGTLAKLLQEPPTR